MRMSKRNGQALLSAQGLVKAYSSRPILDGVNLTLPRGSLTLLLGPNGAGKTTLLKVLGGLLQPDQGSVTYAVPPLRRAYIPDEPILQDNLTVWECLQFVGMVHSIPKAEMEERGRALLDRYGLLAAKDEFPIALSWGMRRKVTLCAALLSSPQLILADEPLSGLDRVSQKRFVDDLRGLLARGGAVLLATHQIGSVDGIVTQSFAVDGGKLHTVSRSELASYVAESLDRPEAQESPDGSKSTGPVGERE